MSLFPRRKSPPAPERSLLDWAALSSMTAHPRDTGDPMLDEWNAAIASAQAYLNGRAVGAETDAETEYLLRLRADLNFLHVAPTGPQAPEDTEPSGADEVEAPDPATEDP